MSDLIRALSDWLWGPPMLTMVVGVGLYLLVRLAAVQVRYVAAAWRAMATRSKGEGDITPFAALMTAVKAKNPAEPEFHQAVHEVAESLTLVLERHPEYRTALICTAELSGHFLDYDIQTLRDLRTKSAGLTVGNAAGCFA